ncbi:TIGR02391 family protein [Eilatimonas milleporae]|uniref:Uncharacterized protein Ymh n=1 Tax=Eilatimonas milleporae TaxID=911205 RepID=A0A3M0CDT1_9PROT|nr:TIGR02391 family protein [Eilatimonas milleporae]RMB07908.1 uncharacterized protein Ymh [Eilatimonas milleporae]
MQFHGAAGATVPCREAIERLLVSGADIKRALILTAGNEHAFLLYIDSAWSIAIKSGFTSGYGGTGPAGFAEVITTLDRFQVEIDEVDITDKELEQINSCLLTYEQAEEIAERRPIRPQRLWDYLLVLRKSDQDGFRGFFSPVLSLGVVDPRLCDLAIDFRKDPDAALVRAFRKLEDIVRERTGLTTSGQKLFSQAFLAKERRLGWDDVDDGEHTGRTNLFISIFGAYRNRRAHREDRSTSCALVREFNLINELFCLERDAVNLRPRATDKSKSLLL